MKNKRIYFLLLTITIIAIDQFTKYLIYKYVPLNTIKYSFWGDFFRIIHVRNLGVGFSLGHDMNPAYKFVFFTIAPTIFIIILLFYAVKTKEVNDFQAFCLFGISGGGFGNIIDRAFRKEGVIDFLDVKFYGIFGLNRWPTFNVADSSVVIFISLIMLQWIIYKIKSKKTKK